MRILLSAILFTIVFTCSNTIKALPIDISDESKSFAILKLTTSKSDFAGFHYFDRFGTLHQIAIGKDENKIEHTEQINLSKPFFLYYSVMPNRIPILLVPGDTIQISVNKNKLTISSIYTGVDAALKIPIQYSVFAYESVMTNIPIKRRERFLDSCYDISKEILIKSQNASNKSIIDYYLKSALYEYLQYKLIRKAVDKSDLLKKIMDSVAFIVNDESFCYSQEHKNLVNTFSNIKWGNNFKEITYFKKMYDSSKAYFKGDVRDENLFSTLHGMRASNNPFYNQYRDLFLKDCENKELLGFVHRNFQTSNNILTDSVYTLSKQIKSIKEEISKNTGNVIYIDVWASWCLPCRREIPDAKRVVEKFKKQNFKYFFISIDDNFDSWIEAVQKEGLVNLQNSYIIRNGNNSSFIRDYHITTIPRYMLIDKKGNFVSTNAKRPSDAKLIDEIEKLLK